jgi:hypothetical protein
MLSRKPQPVAEHEARGDTARIYHEIRQTLRVTGVNLNFRTWAGFPVFFPVMWAAMQPVAASQPFEAASDGLRSRAVDLGLELPPLHVSAALGQSQRYQLARALALYHYINPKLLLFTVLVKRALAREPIPGASNDTELASRIPFGPPWNMAAMEMVDERPGDARLRRIFQDIKKTLGLSSINSDYRTLGLWPDYLEPAWAALKPTIQTQAYQDAAATLEREAASTADRFATPSIDPLATLRWSIVRGLLPRGSRPLSPVRNPGLPRTLPRASSLSAPSSRSVRSVSPRASTRPNDAKL